MEHLDAQFDATFDAPPAMPARGTVVGLPVELSSTACLALADDGRRVAVADDGRLTIYALASDGAIVRADPECTHELPGEATAICWTVLGAVVAVQREDSVVIQRAADDTLVDLHECEHPIVGLTTSGADVVAVRGGVAPSLARLSLRSRTITATAALDHTDVVVEPTLAGAVVLTDRRARTVRTLSSDLREQTSPDDDRARGGPCSCGRPAGRDDGGCCCRGPSVRLRLRLSSRRRIAGGIRRAGSTRRCPDGRAGHARPGRSRPGHRRCRRADARRWHGDRAGQRRRASSAARLDAGTVRPQPLLLRGHAAPTRGLLPRRRRRGTLGLAAVAGHEPGRRVVDGSPRGSPADGCGIDDDAQPAPRRRRMAVGGRPRRGHRAAAGPRPVRDRRAGVEDLLRSADPRAVVRAADGTEQDQGRRAAADRGRADVQLTEPRRLRRVRPARHRPAGARLLRRELLRAADRCHRRRVRRNGRADRRSAHAASRQGGRLLLPAVRTSSRLAHPWRPRRDRDDRAGRSRIARARRSTTHRRRHRQVIDRAVLRTRPATRDRLVPGHGQVPRDRATDARRHAPGRFGEEPHAGLHGGDVHGEQRRRRGRDVRRPGHLLRHRHVRGDDDSGTRPDLRCTDREAGRRRRRPVRLPDRHGRRHGDERQQAPGQGVVGGDPRGRPARARRADARRHPGHPHLGRAALPRRGDAVRPGERRCRLQRPPARAAHGVVRRGDADDQDHDLEPLRRRGCQRQGDVEHRPGVAVRQRHLGRQQRHDAELGRGAARPHRLLSRCVQRGDQAAA